MRVRDPEELAASYGTYLRACLPENLVRKYFKEPITEYFSGVSGLRWYSPSHLGDGEYYSALNSLYNWYYNPGSWDKVRAVEILRNAKASSVVELGSGSGWLLEALRSAGVASVGVEINPDAVASARARGLEVFFPGEAEARTFKCEWLCLLQTIEHVDQPRQFLADAIRSFAPARMILSAPCFEGLLGYTSDPLSWPPHHATAWSEEAFKTLARLVGFRVVDVSYSPLSYDEFQGRKRQEISNLIHGIPRLAQGRVGKYAFAAARVVGVPWATRGHSILVVLERSS